MLTILLIEDDDVDREMVHRLMDEQYRVVDVASGNQALESLHQFRPDCVLMDYRLPDTDGLSLLPAFVSEEIPVVMLTGQGNENIAVEAIKNGAEYYLVKSDLTRDILHRTIQDATEVVLLHRQIEAQQQALIQRTAQAEEQARQLKKFATALTQAEQMERQRLADLLHDHLQQLLTAAVMRVQQASNRLNKMDMDERIRQYLQEAGDLIRDSIQEARSLTVELSPPILHHTDLSASFEWLAGWMKSKYELIVHLHLHSNVQIESDQIKILLFDAVRELLFNVVKHARTNEAYLTVHLTDQNQVQIVVEDFGQGCTKDQLQTDNRMAGQGFGIFSITERLMVYGGTIRFQCTPGKGFRAEILSPISLPQEDEILSTPQVIDSMINKQEPEKSAPNLFHQIRIMLAEDHKIVRQGLAGLLEDEEDFTVIAEAENGQQAVELAGQYKPDVIVMDINMPLLNGIEATQIIKQENPGIQIIGLSVNIDEKTASAMRDAGASHYLYKDGPLEDLCFAIRDVSASLSGTSSEKPI
ncbi:MAG: response regulator [bacterium]